ncbi:hypothetical protein AQJ54_42555 [Streptomyces griseorubiginosus]|uniref:Uncharacterized protein n=2 Tax=Streptomyces griseorubiginosus TaxID=67304 RepID=A0A124HVF0_9ACTN|nr:hypothetical protein AQJ54_42555 [Streptomyces griseorubiginosus]
MPRVEFCFTCWPGGPVTAPPCLRCGSRRLYYATGLCERCHPSAVPPPDSCTNCKAWGATRNLGWLCKGCASWCRKYTTTAACTVCRHDAVLDAQGICRLCHKQATCARSAHALISWQDVTRSGQQLFFADLFSSRHRGALIPEPRPLRPEPLPPATYQQPALFDTARTLRHRGTVGLARRADPHLAAWAEQFTREDAARYGWSVDLTWRVRTGVNIVVGFLQAPGAVLTADDVAVLVEANLPHKHVTAVLERAGLLQDHRIPAVIAWAEQQILVLPPAMAGEVRIWLAVMHEGSDVTPRRRPRSESTIRLHLRSALPALARWAADGKTSLREITAADVRTALPPAGAPRSRMSQGLRSLYRVLKARRLVFTDPAAQVTAGFPDPTIPMPLAVGHIRAALDSADPARALLCALIAFHGLTAHQIQHLQLTDARNGHLDVDGRRIPLADPVSRRLATYLDHRSRRWPATTNPHLFVHFRSATTGTHVGHRWINLHLGPHLTTRALRNDRLLDEALATGNDPKHLTDLFGLSIRAALRYTGTPTHPDLIPPQQDEPQHRHP